MNETDLRIFERLAEQCYSSTNREERLAAERQLAGFDVPDAVSKLQMVLQSSTNVHALFFSCTKLIAVYSTHWNAFSTKQKMEMRNFLLYYMGQHGINMPPYVAKVMLQLLGRIVKLGWLEEKTNMELPEQVKQFFIQQLENPGLAAVGLQIFHAVIVEMNTLVSRRTLAQHRKIVIAFRDMALRNILETSLFILKEILKAIRANQTNPALQKLCREALQLVLAVMQFDFVGIFPDESTEDIGAIQIPTQWRPLFDSDLAEVFWTLYMTLPQDWGQTTSMQILVSISTVRRSLFPGEEPRRKYLETFINGSVNVLQTQTGLSVQENYHEFCRMMLRLKSNFQLNEYVKCKNYTTWIDLLAKFSMESFKSWRITSGSIFYLLNLWARLFSTTAYLENNVRTNLESYVPEIAKQYIASRLECAQEVAKGDYDENPLENEQALVEQLESIPQLVHSNYELVGQHLISIFDPLMNAYRQAISGRQTSNMEICEGQLSWIVYIFGAVTGKRFAFAPSDDNQSVDAVCTARVLQGMNVMNERLHAEQNAVENESVQCFECSILYFLRNFKRMYLSDTMTSHKKMFDKLGEMINFTDQMSLLNVLVNKIAGNLRIWAKNEKIVKETLVLFEEIVTSLSSARLANKLDSVKFILNNHTAENFPFLQVARNMRHRTNFYRTLCKYLFQRTYANEDFENFMAPLEKVCAQLQSIPTLQQFQQADAKFALMGLLRDLRGICHACSNKRSYVLFFEWLYPRYFPILMRTVEAWHEDHVMMIALLRFVSELALNKNRRIDFGPSSPNGIILFKETSKLIETYGSRISNRPVVQDAYTERYKPIMLCMYTVTFALVSNYCNFGVFTLYNDTALTDVLKVVLALIQEIPVDDILQYPKFCKAHYSLLESLFLNHMDLIIKVDTNIFLKLVTSLEDGMQLNDKTLSLQIYSALDHLLAYYYKNLKRNPEKAHIIEQHLQQSKNLFPRILASLFDLILFQECGNQWSVSRTMFSLIVTHQSFFEELKKQIASSLGGERQEKMMNAFGKLTEGVEMNLEPINKERFANNLSTFRQKVGNFL